MQPSLEQALQYLRELDLSYIVQSMCAKSYPLPRWTLADAERCCRLYKNFLVLQKKYAPEPLVPTKYIDEFWHNHILHTKQYISDCIHIFGHYLHHQPIGDEEDDIRLVQEYLRTKAYYLAEFNEPMDAALST